MQHGAQFESLQCRQHDVKYDKKRNINNNNDIDNMNNNGINDNNENTNESNIAPNIHNQHIIS